MKIPRTDRDLERAERVARRQTTKENAANDALIQHALLQIPPHVEVNLAPLPKLEPVAVVVEVEIEVPILAAPATPIAQHVASPAGVFNDCSKVIPQPAHIVVVVLPEDPPVQALPESDREDVYIMSYRMPTCPRELDLETRGLLRGDGNVGCHIQGGIRKT